jgi:protein-S-isoprenylcysteine O-methyltransferase Ste14
MTNMTKPTSRGELWVIAQVVLLVLIIFAPPRLDPIPVLPDTLQGILLILGLLIGISGLSMILASAAYLGSNLTIYTHPKPTASLAQNGIYGIVRHPMYAGVILTALGWSLIRNSIPSFLLTVALALLLDFKAREEERLLVQRFPDYADYSKRVKRLIPFLY